MTNHPSRTFCHRTIELREIMLSHGDYTMSPGEINEMLSHADIDGDGSIKYEGIIV